MLVYFLSHTRSPGSDTVLKVDHILWYCLLCRGTHHYFGRRFHFRGATSIIAEMLPRKASLSVQHAKLTTQRRSSLHRPKNARARMLPLSVKRVEYAALFTMPIPSFHRACHQSRSTELLLRKLELGVAIGTHSCFGLT